MKALSQLLFSTKSESLLSLSVDILEQYCMLNGGNQAQIDDCQIVPKLRFLRQYYYRKGKMEDAVSVGRRVLRWSSDQMDLREFMNCCEAGVS